MSLQRDSVVKQMYAWIILKWLSLPCHFILIELCFKLMSAGCGIIALLVRKKTSLRKGPFNELERSSHSKSKLARQIICFLKPHEVNAIVHANSEFYPRVDVFGGQRRTSDHLKWSWHVGDITVTIKLFHCKQGASWSKVTLWRTGQNFSGWN